MPTLIRLTIESPERNDFVDTRRVTPEEAAIISQLTGEKVDGFVHVIEASAIKHILDGHSGDKNPMTPADIARIPEITRGADIAETKPSNRGTQRIVYEKVENGEVFVVEEVRLGRGKLGLVTAYKTGKAGVTPGEPDAQKSHGPVRSKRPESTSAVSDTLR